MEVRDAEGAEVEICCIHGSYFENDGGCVHEQQTKWAYTVCNKELGIPTFECDAAVW
jgi:hypothetical protein